MRRRKEGFSLVELLIVLAVMAALIATITPVALNAIRKARATQFGQDMKALASSFENYLYVNGTVPANLSQIGRDIDADKYGIGYTSTDGSYTVTVAASGNVNYDALEEVLAEVENSASVTTGGTWLGNISNSDTNIFYNFQFQVY